MSYKNIFFNPKLCTIEDILKREEVQGLGFEKVVYVNEHEALAVFSTPGIQSAGDTFFAENCAGEEEKI